MSRDGGPAFPAMEVRTHDTGDIVENASQGMTLRDWFATHAPAVPSDFTPNTYQTESATDRLIRWRWHYADAMLAKRAKTNK